MLAWGRRSGRRRKQYHTYDISGSGAAPDEAFCSVGTHRSPVLLCLFVLCDTRMPPHRKIQDLQGCIVHARGPPFRIISWNVENPGNKRYLRHACRGTCVFLDPVPMNTRRCLRLPLLSGVLVSSLPSAYLAMPSRLHVHCDDMHDAWTCCMDFCVSSGIGFHWLVGRSHPYRSAHLTWISGALREQPSRSSATIGPMHSHIHLYFLSLRSTCRSPQKLLSVFLFFAGVFSPRKRFVENGVE